jgi:hypothetical protein
MIHSIHLPVLLSLSLLIVSCGRSSHNQVQVAQNREEMPTYGWYCEVHKTGTSEATLASEAEARLQANSHLASISDKHRILILKRETSWRGSEGVRATQPIEILTEEPPSAKDITFCWYNRTTSLRKSPTAETRNHIQPTYIWSVRESLIASKFIGNYSIGESTRGRHISDGPPNFLIKLGEEISKEFGKESAPAILVNNKVILIGLEFKNEINGNRIRKAILKALKVAVPEVTEVPVCK